MKRIEKVAGFEGKDNKKVSAHRILHPLSDNLLKFMSRNYKVNPKHLVTIHRPEYPESVPEDLDAKPQIKTPWSPINEKHYEDDSSDDEAEEDNTDQDNQELVFLMTPPPSNEIAFQAQMIEEHNESPPMSSSP